MSADNEPFSALRVASEMNFFQVFRKSALLFLLLCGLVAAGRPAMAEKGVASASVLYRLRKDATFQEGCFGVCLCAVISAPVRGTFVLTRTGFDGLFDNYAVTEVNWVMSIDGKDALVTGGGKYRIGGEVAVQQQLTLDL